MCLLKECGGYMPDTPITWVLIVLLIILGIFLASCETSFTTANRIRLKVMAENGNRSAKLAMWVINRIDSTIATLLIYNSFVTVALSSLTTIIFVNAIGAQTGLLVATLVVTLVIYIFVDSIPKAITHLFPERFAMINSYIIVVFIILVYPISYLYRLFIKLIQKIFKIKEDTIITEEDFSNVIEQSEQKGVIDETVSEIILSTLVFEDRVVSEVVTPKDKIVAVDIVGLTHQKLNDFILDCNYSRIPIYKNDKNNIVGVIVVREYIKHYMNNKNVRIKNIMSKPYFVKKDIAFDDIIDGYRKHNTHIAFVLDESDQLLGMVTMEDVLQELVGRVDEPFSKFKKRGGGRRD